jgi:lantibiotic leader peptide-processing serine protease
MLRRYNVFPVVAVLALAACSPDQVSAPSKNVPAPSLSVQTGASGPRYIVLTRGAVPTDFASRVKALGGSVKSSHTAAGFAVVTGLTADAASKLAASGIGDVQPDFTVSLEKSIAPIRADATDIGDVEINSAENPAGATRFNRQWNMRQINAPAAWAAGKLGSSSVTVAILDTGIDYDLPDMNGLVDLSRSTSFMDAFEGSGDDPTTPEFDADPIVPADDTIITKFFPSRALITDLNGHGTNVATQVSSNAVRYAGVTSRTKLIGVKVLGANGVGSGSDILNGVLWAADNGADVANMSLGGFFSKSGNGQSVAAINQVFNYARQKGMVIVVSAGNSGIDLKHIGNFYSTFCDAPNVICVSAVGPGLGSEIGTPAADAPAFYTNFGKNNVDVAAPGGNAKFVKGVPAVSSWPWGLDIASWVWSYCAKQSLIIERNEADPTKGDLFLTTCFTANTNASLLNNGYIGTSQASPHVAGLAALLIAENGKGNPNLIKQLIQKSGAATSRDVGRGRIDVKAALGL